MEEFATFFFIGLVAFGFATYIFLMLFYPEWVGITGKAALKNLSEHQEGSTVDDSDPFSSESKPKS
jgi:hypothetical protein